MAINPLILIWDNAGEESRLELLRHAAIPFPAHSPVESAQQAILNLLPEELERLWDWMGETHQLPPGVN